jgi:hypothetical protein
MNRVLKAAGTPERLKPKYDELLPSFAFNFHLRHYNLGKDFDVLGIDANASFLDSKKPSGRPAPVRRCRLTPG